jgi:hypothetical protein
MSLSIAFTQPTFQRIPPLAVGPQREPPQWSWPIRALSEEPLGGRPDNRAPRFELRARWPRGSPCARPQTLIKGAPGVRLELAVTFEARRKHLPIISLKRVA